MGYISNVEEYINFTSSINCFFFPFNESENVYGDEYKIKLYFLVKNTHKLGWVFFLMKLI